MRLKYLSLSLFSLSLTACSSHVIKTNSLYSNLDTTQRATQALNAIYETPNFDYSGKIKIDLNQNKQGILNQNEKQQPRLDPEIEKKLNQYLVTQKIKLRETEKQALYQQMAQPNVIALSEIMGKGAAFVETMLNDLNIHYDGTVNYRQKMASFNLITQYKKPNLSVEMRIPTIIDFNNYKFYTHIFSLMPYLASPEDQDKYVYFDFSKYKDQISSVDQKALLEYLKQSSVSTYLVADQNDLRQLNVNGTERQQGVVEKIRLQGNVEELFLKANLYSAINREYLMQSVFKMDAASEQSAIKNLAAQVVSDELEDTALNEDDDHNEYDEATAAIYKLYKAVNKTVLNHNDEAEALAIAETASAVADATDATIQLADHVDDEDDSVHEASSAEKVLLTSAQCESLAQRKANIRMGDVVYCQSYYDMNVLDTAATSSLTELQNSARIQALTEKFKTFGRKDHLVDAQQFKQLWLAHQDEIEAALPIKNKRNPFVIDFYIDQYGRMVKMDYDLKYHMADLQRQFNVKFDIQIQNYGKATQIDRQTLKQAKPFAEIFKDGFINRIFGSLSEQTPDSTTQSIDFSKQLTQLAKTAYQQTKSYEKTYQIVFIAKLTHDYPEIVKQYTTQDLQEIAAVYAYAYTDEDIYNPKGQALKYIQLLKKKHHLEEDDQFDHDLGNDVDDLVEGVWTTRQGSFETENLLKKHKTVEAAFAYEYMQKFEAENTIDDTQRQEFKKTAHILAKAYTAFRSQKFNQAIVANLTENSVEFIDYELFKNTYEKFSQANLK